MILLPKDFSPFSPFLTISLCGAGHYLSHPVFPILCHVFSQPCLQSVGIASCLPLCCLSSSFSVDFCSFSHKLLVLVTYHRCGLILASGSSQTHFSLLFSSKYSTGFMRASFLMSSLLMWSNLVFHTAQLNILIEFTLIFLLYSPTFRTVCNCWYDDSFEECVFQFHKRLPIAHYPGHFFPHHPPDSYILLCVIHCV